MKQGKSLDYYGDNPIIFNELDNILILKAAKDTPEVKIDKNLQLFSVKGSCYLEKSSVLFNLLETTFKELKFDKLTVVFDIMYINSSSTKQLIDLLEYLIRTIPHIEFSWRCEESDEDMEDLIQVTSENLNIPIEIISYKYKSSS